MANAGADNAVQGSAAAEQSGFSLGLCAAGIIATSAGLAAAALDIRWGAAPRPGDALQTAWVNVNVMLMLTWLVVWPAVALRPNRASAAPGAQLSETCGTCFLWDFAALAVAAIPALGVGAFLSGADAAMIAGMLALQIGVGIFAMGLLAFCIGRGSWEAAGAGVLAALAVAGPVAVYLSAEFFALAWNGWYGLVPVVAVVRVARANGGGMAAIRVGAIYGVAGALLWFFRPKRRAV